MARVRRGRWLLAACLVVLVGLLTPVAVLARYARSEVLDTDRFAATVGPLAGVPEVQAAVASAVTDRIVDRLDVEGLVAEALDALVGQGAPEALVAVVGPLADQVRSYVHDQVLAVVESERFATLWEQVSRAAHGQVVGLLTGEGSGALAIEDGTLTLDLAPVVVEVRERLVDRGFALAGRIPDTTADLTVLASVDLTAAERGVRLLDRAGAALPWVVVLVGALAVVAAPDRRRGLAAVAVAAGAGLVLVGGALAVARRWYVEHGQPGYLDRDAALAIAQQVLAPLRTTLRAAFVLAAVVAIAAWLAGPSAPARAVRRGVAGVVGRRAAPDRPATALEAWVGANKRPVRIAVVAAGCAAFVLWTYPSGTVVLVIAALVALGLVVVEVLGRAAAPSPAAGPATQGGTSGSAGNVAVSQDR